MTAARGWWLDAFEGGGDLCPTCIAETERLGKLAASASDARATGDSDSHAEPSA